MTPADALLDRLIHAAYDAAISDDWSGFLTLYGESFPASKCGLGIFDGEQANVNASLAVNYDLDAMGTYMDHYSHISPWVAMTRRTDDWSVAWGHETVPQEVILRSEFYNDWLRHQDDVQMGFGINVASSGQRVFVITNNFNPRHGDAAAMQFRLAERLVPHLRRAFALQRQISGQKIRLDALDQGLATVGHAVFIVDPDGQTHFFNAAAEALVREGAAVQLLGGGELRFPAHRDHEAVFRLVRQIGARSYQAMPPALRLTGDPARHLVAFVAPARTRAGPDGWIPVRQSPAPARALIMLVDITGAPRSPEAVLAAALRLSPALARLAAAFAQGESLKDYAARHGVSYETVRTQMKQLMDAVGVNRQALLMRTLITLSGIRTPV